MPGTVIRDALESDLIAGNAELAWPGDVQFLLESNGSTSGYSVTVRGADDAGFTTNVVEIAHFVGVGANQTHRITTYCDKRYIGVTGAAGTAGTVTLKVVPPHDRRVRATFGA